MKRFRFPVQIVGTVDVEAEDIKDARLKVKDLIDEEDIEVLWNELNIDDVSYLPKDGKEVKGNE